MPEGDTVWRTATHLNRALAGHELTRCDLRVPAFATVDLSGRVVDEVVSRGKHILMRIEGDTIASHLKMEGAWHIYRSGARWRRPAFSARAVLEIATYQAVGFSLGYLKVVPRDAESEVVGHLGPDLLGPDWDAPVALHNLQQRPDREIFLALLDQRNLAGLGNEYANELLFLFGLHPRRTVASVPDLARLVDRGQKLLDLNKATVDRSFTGSTRTGQERWVYGRDRAPCRRCATLIVRGDLGDSPTTERQTFWCPHCQPAPTDETSGS